MKAIPGQLISLIFFVGLLSFSANSFADALDAGTPSIGATHLAKASTDSEDDEEDEEEEAVDYRDRVREIQDWMNRRDSERKGDAPSLNVAPVAPPQTFPKYFRDNGYDENGYRKQNSEARIKRRDAPDNSFAPRYHRRHHSWHQRWHRHVHPYIHARRQHFHSIHEHSHTSHHSHQSAEISHHFHGQSTHKGAKHEQRQAATITHKQHAVTAVKTSHSKSVSKPVKKVRSKR